MTKEESDLIQQVLTELGGVFVRVSRNHPQKDMKMPKKSQKKVSPWPENEPPYNDMEAWYKLAHDLNEPIELDDYSKKGYDNFFHKLWTDLRAHFFCYSARQLADLSTFYTSKYRKGEWEGP